MEIKTNHYRLSKEEILGKEFRGMKEIRLVGNSVRCLNLFVVYIIKINGIPVYCGHCSGTGRISTYPRVFEKIIIDKILWINKNTFRGMRNKKLYQKIKEYNSLDNISITVCKEELDQNEQKLKDLEYEIEIRLRKKGYDICNAKNQSKFTNLPTLSRKELLELKQRIEKNSYECSKFDNSDPCQISTYSKGKDYAIIRMKKIRKEYRVHRIYTIICERLKENNLNWNPPINTVARHMCNNKKCFVHIKFGTQLENCHDCRKNNGYRKQKINKQSGYFGIRWGKKWNRWDAYYIIRTSLRKTSNKYVGSDHDKHIAALKRELKIIKYNKIAEAYDQQQRNFTDKDMNYLENIHDVISLQYYQVIWNNKNKMWYSRYNIHNKNIRKKVIVCINKNKHIAAYLRELLIIEYNKINSIKTQQLRNFTDEDMGYLENIRDITNNIIHKPKMRSIYKGRKNKDSGYYGVQLYKTNKTNKWKFCCNIKTKLGNNQYRHAGNDICKHTAAEKRELYVVEHNKIADKYNKIHRNFTGEQVIKILNKPEAEFNESPSKVDFKQMYNHIKNLCFTYKWHGTLYMYLEGLKNRAPTTYGYYKKWCETNKIMDVIDYEKFEHKHCD